MTSKAILILSVFLLMTPKLIFAHGGGHAEEKPTPSLMEETTSFSDSIYSIGSEEGTGRPSIEGVLLDSPFSSINTLDGDIPLMDDMKTREPMKRFKEKTNSPEQHDQHKKQHVEESLHEWVSPDAKGHKVAISITIIAGLSFIGLSFFRFGEKN